MSDVQPIGAWREVEDFPAYEVSDLGYVRRRLPPFYVLLLKSSPNDKGYLRVFLCRDKKAHTRYVHRLVAAAFLGPCPEGMEVNHKDFDKANCRADNLEYLTRQGNTDHAVAHQRLRQGITHYKARFTEDDVREMRRLYGSGHRIRDLLKQFHCTSGVIAMIVQRKRWKHLE